MKFVVAARYCSADRDKKLSYSSYNGDRRGVAAVEFALIAPILLLLLGGVADFGLLTWSKGQLANGVAQGVQYALLTGPSVTASSVRSKIQNGVVLAGMTAGVTVQVSGPACYCVSGSPAALPASSTPLSSSYACTSTCPVSNQSPEALLTIIASYSYQPLMPLYSQLSTTTVAESVVVRLL